MQEKENLKKKHSHQSYQRLETASMKQKQATILNNGSIRRTKEFLGTENVAEMNTEGLRAKDNEIFRKQDKRAERKNRRAKKSREPLKEFSIRTLRILEKERDSRGKEIKHNITAENFLAFKDKSFQTENREQIHVKGHHQEVSEYFESKEKIINADDQK